MAKDGTIITIKDSGISDHLAKFAQNVPKARQKALREGAKLFAEEVEKVTPVGPPRPENKYGGRWYSTVHMKDDVKYQKLTDGRYIVGYGKATGWRAHFVNDGTIYIKPTFFFNKVVESKLGNSYTTIENVLRNELFKK